MFALLPENVTGATLYVGGVGPGNYTTIQAAINAASQGDTVIVYSGTYYEHVVVDRTLSLIGEDRNTTIVDGGGNGDVINVIADWTNITGFKLVNSGTAYSGILLDSVKNSAIYDNNISLDNGVAIFTIFADRSSVSHNVFSNNEINIAVMVSEGSVIENNTISDGVIGIDLSSCINTTVAGNIISNTSYGIELAASINVTLTDNVMTKTGILVRGGIDHWNTHTIDTSNMVNGRPVRYWKDTIGGTIPPGAGQVILANTTGVIVRNQNLSDTSAGIQVGYSSWNIIADNDVSSNKVSGVDLEYCTNGTVANNTVSGGTRPGMMLSSSTDITLANNTMVGDGVYIWGDLQTQWDSHSIDTSNTVNAKPVYYWKASVGGTIPLGAGQVILANSTGVGIRYQDLGNGAVGIQLGFSSGNTITDNSIYSNTWEGITVYRSDSNTISYNTMTDNLDGIEFYSSSGNMVFRNNITSNDIGSIILFSSDGNTIHHNNFIENKGPALDIGTNSWDDGYPSGGNYWSDYTGTDFQSGPNQNLPGSDGVGDTPYFVSGSAVDRYPLMLRLGPWRPSAPLNLRAVAGDAQVALSWAAPALDGGSPITNFRIYRGVGPNPMTFLIEIGNTLTYTDTGLSNGLTYRYEVVAKNSVGQSVPSREAAATPLGLPSSPANLAASAGNKTVILTWLPPTDDGGSPITNYRIYRGDTSGGELFLTETANVLTFTDTGLANGQAYYYQVTAENAVGEGPRSPEAGATPATVPGSPTGLTAVAGDGQVVLTWLTPTDDGGSPITNYSVYRWTGPVGEPFLIEIGNVLTYTDTDVVNGRTYYYKVTAKNSVGEGPFSNLGSATPFAPNYVPLCTIISPEWGDEVSGRTMIVGIAEDLDGIVEHVEVRIDNGPWILASGSTYWTHVLDTGNLTDGEHWIYARSFDGTDYSATASVTVHVRNEVTPPPEVSIFQQPWFWVTLATVVIVTVLLSLLFLKMKRNKKTGNRVPARSPAQESGEEKS